MTEQCAFCARVLTNQPARVVRGTLQIPGLGAAGFSASVCALCEERSKDGEDYAKLLDRLQAAERKTRLYQRALKGDRAALMLIETTEPPRTEWSTDPEAWTPAPRGPQRRERDE